MKKKSLFSLLALMLSLLLLAGCGSNTDAPAQNAGTAAPAENTAPAEPTDGAETAEPTEPTEEPLAYPEHPVTIVVPDKAGGSGDTLARLTAAELEEALGGTFTVVNKEGSGGQLGMIDVANAAPDGYTIGYFTDFSSAASFAGGGDLGYTVDQLDFVCSITAGTNIIILGPDFPGEKSIQGLVDYAKENPGAVTVGVAASGQAMVLSSLMEEADIELTQVLFDSGSETYTNLIGKHISAAILGTKFDKQCAAEGCTTVAVTSHERFSLLPDVPTLVESGYNVLNNEVSRSFVVPKGTPQEIIGLLAETIHQVTDTDEFRQTLADNDEMYVYRDGPDARALYDQKFEQLQALTTAE